MTQHALVTGATGFIGAELACQLVSKGWYVKALVRCDPHDRRAKALVAAAADLGPGELDVVQGSILDQARVETLLKDVDVLFHVASPFVIDTKDPEAELIKPAVEGTRAVIRAAAAHTQARGGRLRKVVLTSSVAAVHDCNCTVPPKAGPKYSEEDWNESSTLEKEAYWVSKVRAEKEAYALSQELGVPLATILPEFVMGPVRTAEAASTSLSAGFLKAFLDVAPGGSSPQGAWIFSDVREVAAAHILAAEQPSASGRYIVASDGKLSHGAVAAALHKALPGRVPAPAEGVDTSVQESNVSAQRVQKELGLALRPVQETLVDAARSLLALASAHLKQEP